MKQHLHNRIGNAVGEHKRKLFNNLKAGAEFERELDVFMEELSGELRAIVPLEDRLDDTAKIVAQQLADDPAFADQVENEFQIIADIAKGVGHVPPDALPRYDRLDKATINASIDRHEKCEALAAAAVRGFDEKQELALVSLLNEIASADDSAEAQNLATSALYAAFKASSGLHDAAIRMTIAAANGGDDDAAQ